MSWYCEEYKCCLQCEYENDGWETCSYSISDEITEEFCNDCEEKECCEYMIRNMIRKD